MQAARSLAAPFRLFLLSASLALPTMGCAALGAVLPDVIAAVVDGQQILDAIADFVTKYFTNHPDPAAQTKVDEALAKARGALNVALRVAKGANGVANAQVDQAFADFEAAYLELVKLCAPYGVKVTPGHGARFQAAPGALYVPEPLAVSLAHKNGGK